MSKILKGQKIAVLAGGPSCEREISLISGKAVFDALEAKGLSVILLDPVGNFITTLKKENVSMVFIALHGTFGEDGVIQKILEDAGISYTGSGVKASELCFDKARTQEVLRGASVRVPDFFILRESSAISFGEPPFLPYVVKPSKSGSSVGVTISDRGQDYQGSILSAFQYSEAVLVEKFIEGRELTVGILGDDVLPVVEVIAARKFYDYEAKYKDSGTRYEYPAQLSPKKAKEVSDLAMKVYKALGCEVMARVDIILGKDNELYVLEVNTIPGLTGKSLLPKAAQAKGIDFSDLCVRILELSLARMEQKLIQA